MHTPTVSVRFARLALLGLLPTLAFVGTACSDNDDDTTTPNNPVELKAYSVTPSLVKTMPGFESLQVFPLIGSDDVLPASPGFVFGGQPDGAALLKNPSGEGYVLINNHEIRFSVSRVMLDKTFKPVSGEYIVDADGGGFRLCSATLATPEEHGFAKSTFLTAGETDENSMVHAIDPLAPANKKDRSRMLPALGKGILENAVPLTKNAYPGKSVILIGEDNADGQLLAYVSNTVGDLENGKLYMLKRRDGNTVETSMAVGTFYDVDFVEVAGAKTMTGAQIAAASVTLGAIQFARVEDVDYRRGSAANNREIYFTATGVATPSTFVPVTGKTKWGRVYHLSLDANDALKGRLEVIIDGDTNPGNSIVNPDNICVTDNFVYTQEDGDSGYAGVGHDGRIWQYNLATKQNTPMLEMNHRRTDATFNAKYNTTNEARLSFWEYGAMYDISDIVNTPNTFLVNIHPHTWRDPKFLNPDGSTANNSGTNLGASQEGGQVLIVRGVAK